MEWRNQTAVVTGGARGLGRATARLLAQRGAAVCVNYAVHAEAAETVVAEITSAGGRAIAVAADVGDLGRGRGDGCSRRSGTRSGHHLGEQRRRVLAGNTGHLRPGAGRAHAPDERGWRDPCHARSDAEHAGAALRPDRQCGLDRGDRHRVSGNAFYAATKPRPGTFSRDALPWSWASTASP